jgi:hypothetical protein
MASGRLKLLILDIEKGGLPRKQGLYKSGQVSNPKPGKSWDHGTTTTARK